ncbi:MAG: NAD(P)H-hydrate dehydratase [Verrucomicrobia bacterium]|nr:NAD(P)H-hydrate dehydratase [Verrucomicrobiota bacterium]
MNVLSPTQARAWEEKSLKTGHRLKDLMREAVDGAWKALQPFLPDPGQALVLVGPGHNGDDAVLLGLELKHAGWDVEFLLSRSPGRRVHPDPRVKPKIWKKALVWPVKPARFLQAQGPRLVVDGLLGLGATPPPHPAEGGILSWISQQKKGADLYAALDLPSGLHPANGSTPGPVFPADLTLALGSVKAGCLRDSASPWIGQIRGVPVKFGVSSPKSNADFFLPSDARQLLRRRPVDLHKRSAGVVHLWTGSHLYPGAACLSCLGALRSGAGYVRLFNDRTISAPLSPHLPELLLIDLPPGSTPEVETFLSGANAFVIGSGLPPSETLESFLTEILPKAKGPIVLDAGALDVLARRPDLISTAGCPLILTPHAGELSRLLGKPIHDRADAAKEWIDQHPSTILVLKGPHTLVAHAGHPLSHNGSGGPSMATAGMGDLLSGLLGGLLASGYPAEDACRLGVVWHGLAADHSFRHGGPAVLASDVAVSLPTAWRKLLMGAV